MGQTSLLKIGETQVPLLLVRNPKARRYILRVRADGVRVTIPRSGTLAEAKAFASRHTAWLERQFQRINAHAKNPVAWTIGTEVLFRGESPRLEVDSSEPGIIRLGTERIALEDDHGAMPHNLRPAVERRLRALAERELPERVFELAALHQLAIRRVTVRAQKTRWGSCSRKGTISLNWRLIQTPPHVSDYIILHELAHLREMNHSARFWREVARLCPEYPTAERWLKHHSRLLR